ncbi:hypothetical protein [Mucilaginibacter sp. BT774]|uniref:hypothetical protein n=1 Tax=Mucilaginibacter sp. BT774 TaxID=3062276 RepID=UPI002676EECD|nr:hypothetical protein [Mucilaginibacter sp. BT774]MDO3628802.1 hypothetical protein [Mucilaginibacter sp. BT774]
MEDDFLIPDPAAFPPDRKQELAMLFLDILDYTGLVGSLPEQIVSWLLPDKSKSLDEW